MAILRSKEFWTVAYFLTRCGNRTVPGAPSGPPPQLGVTGWNEAYGAFFDKLGDDRSPGSFASSLKNARDSFDGYLDSGRVGWRVEGEDRPPQPLSRSAREVFSTWHARTDEELWEYVAQFVGSSPPPARATTQSPTDGDEPPPRQQTTVLRIVRDTAKARELKALYSFQCQVCSQVIQTLDGDFYAEAHHIRPLGGVHNGPDAKSNMLVLCPTHHAMFDYGIPRFIAVNRILLFGVEMPLTCLHELSEEAVNYHNRELHDRRLPRAEART